MRYLPLGVMALLLFPLTASACLNDSEGITTEREFRSSYQTQPLHSTSPPANAPRRIGDDYPDEDSSALPSHREWNWSGIGVAAVGLALIAGAVQITRAKHSR